jgi:hypothetical protein
MAFNPIKIVKKEISPRHICLKDENYQAIYIEKRMTVNESGQLEHSGDLLIRNCPICEDSILLFFEEAYIYDCHHEKELDPALEIICNDCTEFLNQMGQDDKFPKNNIEYLFVDQLNRYLEREAQIPKPFSVIHCPFCNSEFIMNAGDPRGSGVATDFHCRSCDGYFPHYDAVRSIHSFVRRVKDV